MRIPRGLFPSRAVAKGKDAPPNLADCNLVVRDGVAYLCATDGHIAVVVAAEDFDPVADIPGHVPVEAVEGAETHRTDEWNPRITAGPGAVIVDLAEQPQQILSASRSEGALYPDLLTVAKRAWGTPPKAVARLNVKLLSRLARAIGAEGIELGLHGEDGLSFITVRRAIEDDRFMALMAPLSPADNPTSYTPARDNREEEKDESTKTLLDEILERFEEEKSAAAGAEASPTGDSTEITTCTRCGASGQTISVGVPGGTAIPPLCPACFEAATATVQAAFSGVDPAILEDDDDEEEEDDA